MASLHEISERGVGESSKTVEHPAACSVVIKDTPFAGVHGREMFGYEPAGSGISPQGGRSAGRAFVDTAPCSVVAVLKGEIGEIGIVGVVAFQTKDRLEHAAKTSESIVYIICGKPFAAHSLATHEQPALEIGSLADGVAIFVDGLFYPECTGGPNAFIFDSAISSKLESIASPRHGCLV